MRENWRDTLSNWMVRSLPLFVSVLWLFISFIPLNSEISNNARPMFGLLCVFFWAVYRPYLFGLGAIFLLGVFADLQSIAPLGINLFMFLIMYLLVTNLSKYIPEKTFELMWLGLALLLFAVMFSGWFLLSVYYAQFLPVKGMIFSYFISLAVYPVVGGINALIVNNCLQEEN